MNLVSLEKEVEKLSSGEFEAFTRWIDDYASQKWDSQFEQDVKNGKLDALGEKADRAFDSGKCTEL